jgi:hypothetical protein
MKIVYNPKDGAPITAFIHNGVLIDPHYPDGFENKEGISNGLVQYQDDVAEGILETYLFLKPLTNSEAQAIIARPEKDQYNCEFPECDFSTNTKVALIGHSRKHANTDPEVPESVIPVAKGKKIIPLADNEMVVDNETKNGTDKEGVDWYGEGVTIDKRSDGFGSVKPVGQGHFGG